MAIVKLEVGDAVPGRGSGAVFYERSGRVVVKRWQKPVDPRTPEQLRERVGMATAARLWAGLDPAFKVALDGAACDPSWTSYGVWFWLYSALQWVEELIDLVPLPVPVPWLPDVACLDVNPVTGMPIVSVSAPGAPVGMRAGLSVSRPLSPGRFARRGETRRGPSLPLDTVVDLGDWYAAKFGGPPNPGQTLSYLASLLSGSPAGMSCPTWTHCVPSVGGDCTTDPASGVVFPFGELMVNVSVFAGCGGSGDSFDGTVITPGWSVGGPLSVSWGIPSPMTLSDTTGVPRSDAVEVAWANVGDPGCVCSSFTSIDVT